MVAEMTLVDIGMQAMRIEELLFEAQGELTPEMEARMDELLSDGKEALDSAAWVVRKLEADAETCKAEAKRYRERAEAAERNAEALKERMLFTVDATFKGKLKTERNTIWGQTYPASLAIEVAPDADLEKIAHDFPACVRKAYSLDKVEIKHRIEAGDPEFPPPTGITVTEKPATRYLRIK